MRRLIAAQLLVAIAALSSTSGCRTSDAGRSATTNEVESVISGFSTNSPEARKRIEHYVVKNPVVGEQILLRIAYTHKFNDPEARTFMVQQMGKLKMPGDKRTYDILGVLAGTGDADACVALMEMGNSTADKLLGRGISLDGYNKLGELRNRPVVFDGLLRVVCAAQPGYRHWILYLLSADEYVSPIHGEVMEGQTPPPRPPPVRYAPYSELTNKEVERRIKAIEGLDTNDWDRRSLDLLEQVKKALQRPTAK